MNKIYRNPNIYQKEGHKISIKAIELKHTEILIEWKTSNETL